MTTSRNTRFPVKDLPSGIPFVPVFDGEADIDAQAEARAFRERLAAAVDKQDWEAFSALFHDDVAWWRDNFTLTFDRRTLHGKDAITSAWKAMVPARKPSDFGADESDTVGLQPMWLRMAPVLATLDVPFSFKTAAPDTRCFGIAKLVPVEKDGKREFKVWIMMTNARSLVSNPFETLPRQRPSVVPTEERGIAQAHGLPTLAADTVLDAVVVGASMNGVSNSIMLDAAGANFVTFESHSSPGGNWAARYHGVTLHHPKVMIQLPQFPVPEDQGYPEYLSGVDLTRYMSSAVEKLKLPVYAGVTVKGNVWDKEANVWRVNVMDTASGKEATVSARNVVLCSGWLVNKDNIHKPSLSGQELFKGPVQHTEEYSTSEPYVGKNVVVVGSGNSAHDVAQDLALNGAGSVTILQRRPGLIADFGPFAAMLETPFRMAPSIDAADANAFALPTAVMRDMMGGAISMLIKSSEERNKELESKGYMLEREVSFIERAFEQRGRSFYFDQPGTFKLVFEDRIKIAHGDAQGFSDKGLVVKDLQTGETRVQEAEGVVFATGYKTIDLPAFYKRTGFFEAEVADALENVCHPGVDSEGEMPGLLTNSGHPHLFFSGFGIFNNRLLSRPTALQIVADVTGQTPERYTRSN